jgi:phage terminase large subunit GpA-like protein
MNVETDASSSARALIAKVRGGFAPPPELKVSEFSDEHIIVTSGPLAGTHWQTAFAPYQRGILDAFHEPGVQTVVVMGSSQWGKTACAINVVAYHIAHDPCPILVVEPTVDPMAIDFSRNRLEPVIEASPILSSSVGKKRQKNATNTTLSKTFRGGAISIGGANSAASLASRSVRLLVLDEVDRYPPELPGEGSTLRVAMKRTQAYLRRRRILMLSSPTLEGAPIHTWFQRGDQRRYHVPCPECGHMHAYEWKNVRWTDADPLTARLHCPECDHGITDAERVAILSRGEWRATNPGRRDKSIISFHLWEAYSPLSSLSEIVSNFLAAREKQKTGDKSEMHTWQNTTLGEPVAHEAGEGVEPHALLLRREAYPPDIDVPAGACCLTMGVDVQDDRLEALVIGWGPGDESWLVDRQTLPGDTSQPDPWRMLDELLDTPYRHASGHTLLIHAACIDSGGHRTTLVYDYAERKAARRVYAIIGRDGQRPIVSSPSPRRWGRQERQVPLYTIGVDAAKALLISRLALTEKGPGYIHLPHADWCDEELAAQLTSERLVLKWSKGIPQQVWQKIRPRNEALDMAVYAISALRLLNPKLAVMKAALEATPPPQPPPSTGQPPATPAAPRGPAPQRRVVRSSYLSR